MFCDFAAPPGYVIPPPLQALKRAIQLLWWENLSSPRTVRDLLSLVYSHKPSALDDRLIDRILQATRHPAALDAFASILLAPKSRLNFDQMLAAVSCPIVMAYGRDDPWVVPLWGQRLKRAVPSAVYLELSPSGHCPHHETPAAMNRAIEASIASLERRHPHPLAVGQAWQVTEADGRAVRIEHVDGSARNVFERVDQAVWRLVQRLRGTSGAAGSSGAAPAERSA